MKYCRATCELSVCSDSLITNLIVYDRSMMVRNLVRLCEMLGGRYPNLANSRQIVTEPFLSVFYFLKGMSAATSSHIKIT